ncbi:MAG TPA: RDD family protein [Burkholderiaceae bacterium]|jgi:uncharacterized RDD family membrane protein YckC|nr:RDD family protein [Burkholderiaceae bacterium]
MASYGDSRYAPPSANVADIASQQGALLASRWRRLFAIWIDGFALYALGVLLARAGLPTAWSKVSPNVTNLFAFNPLALIDMVLFLLVNGYLLVDRGQTVGKAALGMRIVRPDGSKVSAARMLGLRYGVGFSSNLIPALGVLYGLVDCVMIFRKSRRCLHDEIADTIVVRA